MSQTYFTLLTAVGEAKLANAAALRHGARWNVLEDALWQGLSTHVDPNTPCSLR